MELIESKEISQKELSVILGIVPCMIVKWKDQINDLHLSTLLKIADYFECSLEYLCGKTSTELDYIPKPCPAFGEWLPEVLKQTGKS